MGDNSVSSSSVGDSTVEKRRSRQDGHNDSEPPGSEPPPQSFPSSTGNTNGNFECNICLDQAQDAVVSRCGHLFCWPCLHRWLEVKKSHSVCPVCKAAISRDSVIPLYGRGSDHTQDPRDKVPPRPHGVRTEPETQRESTFSAFSSIFGTNTRDGGQGSGGNFQVSFGIGPFPFGLLATTFNIGGDSGTAGNGDGQNNNQAEAEILSKLFLGIAIFFIIWLIMA